MSKLEGFKNVVHKSRLLIRIWYRNHPQPDFPNRKGVLKSPLSIGSSVSHVHFSVNLSTFCIVNSFNIPIGVNWGRG